MQTLAPEVIIRINGNVYAQDIDCPINQLQVGDVVLDKKDLTHGVIDTIIGDSCSVKDSWVAELGVPLTRLIKLNLIAQ